VSFGNARGELRAGAGGAPQELRITLQLGSFRVASEAGAQADSLRAAGFDARVAEEHNSKRPWYRVQTGLFGARADAEQRLAALRAKGFAADYTVRELQ
jgi:cell division protein FtsN